VIDQRPRIPPRRGERPNEKKIKRGPRASAAASWQRVEQPASRPGRFRPPCFNPGRPQRSGGVWPVANTTGSPRFAGTRKAGGRRRPPANFFGNISTRPERRKSTGSGFGAKHLHPGRCLSVICPLLHSINAGCSPSGAREYVFFSVASGYQPPTEYRDLVVRGGWPGRQRIVMRKNESPRESANALSLGGADGKRWIRRRCRMSLGDIVRPRGRSWIEGAGAGSFSAGHDLSEMIRPADFRSSWAACSKR